MGRAQLFQSASPDSRPGNVRDLFLFHPWPRLSYKCLGHFTLGHQRMLFSREHYFSLSVPADYADSRGHVLRLSLQRISLTTHFHHGQRV